MGLAVGEEVVEVLISDPSRKAEIEILQELIPIAKARYSAGRARDNQAMRVCIPSLIFVASESKRFPIVHKGRSPIFKG